MRISTRSHYGLQAMAYLANQDRFCSVKEIAGKEKVPFDYLGKIILKLKKAKMVKVKRGVKGGYALSLPAEEIKVGDIIKVLERSTTMVPCIRTDKNCQCPQFKKCLTKDLWKKLQNGWEEALASVTLADSLKNEKNQ